MKATKLRFHPKTLEIFLSVCPFKFDSQMRRSVYSIYIYIFHVYSMYLHCMCIMYNQCIFNFGTIEKITSDFRQLWCWPFGDA